MQGFQKRKKEKKSHEINQVVQLTGLHKPIFISFIGRNEAKSCNSGSIGIGSKILLMDEPFAALDVRTRENALFTFVEDSSRNQKNYFVCYP
ncbi:MAG: hypothetical protein P0116_06580 [Candidatus Nitrosocosmicus sp.]|nr:hypothetical protein [Candidatus Nitrosocosmicus sp.]